uniref:Glutaredoxin domain-containing protein n=1 Tax=Steinernema glaseri TaxID=37863 RepID=A0A1I8ACJ4_9BILA
MALVHLKTKEEFEKFIANQGTVAVHFGASWADPCSSVDVILTEYMKEMKDLKAARIEAEEVADVSLKYAITAAPTVVIFKNGADVGKVNGFNPVELREAITKLSFVSGAPKEAEPAAKEDLNDRLKRLINKSRLALFMKGNPQQPRCGFSRQMIELLKNVNADYWSFDILSDEEVRQGLKVYSNWPTFPQLYLDGELLGGLDVVREELQDPEFVANLPKLS